MTLELVKAILVGIIVALPVGPVLMMVIHKTLEGGKTAGMMTGFGSAVGDSFLAAVGLLALGAIEEFILRYSGPIMLVGSLLLMAVGLSMALTATVPDVNSVLAPRSKKTLASYSLQAMLAVFSNPAAYALMFGLLGIMHLAYSDRLSPSWAVVLCVGLGELLYWALVVYVLARFVKVKTRTMRRIKKGAGIVVCCFSVALLVKGIVTFL